jgi:hypothetical protein
MVLPSGENELANWASSVAAVRSWMSPLPSAFFTPRDGRADSMRLNTSRFPSGDQTGQKNRPRSGVRVESTPRSRS